MYERRLPSKKTMGIFTLGIAILGFFVANYMIALFVQVGDYMAAFMTTPETATFSAPPWQEFFYFKPIYLMGYGLFYIFILGLLAKFYYNLKMNFSDLDKGQHGTREFATTEELKQQYRAIPAADDEYEGAGGVIIGGLQEPLKPYRLLIDDSPVHTMIIGITRSGKGETFVVPMIDVLSRAKEKPSMVINDPKGELAGASYETLKKRGYEVYVFNLLEQHMGMGFNPLQLVIDAWKKGEYSLAAQYANSIGHSLYYDPNAKEAFWGNSASSLVKAIILALVEDSVDRGEEHKVNLYSVANFLSTLGSDNDEQTGTNALDQFFQARDELNPARMMYATSNFAGGNTRSSIFSIAMDKLQIFTSEPNARLTSYNSMDLTRVGFGDKPVAVFMVVPDFDSSNHVLASIFVSQLYRVNAEKASMEDGKMKRHVHFLLDEFGNMPTVEGMAGMVTVGAGRGFRFHLIIQAYAQIKTKYGDEGDTIIGNCSNQIYILTNDKQTAEQYSALLGNKTITDVSRSGHLFSFDKTHSESTKERPLLMHDELMQLKLGESVVIRVNKREDLKRKKIIPKPIYNALSSGTAQKFRWEYLAEDFDTTCSVVSLPLTSSTYYILNMQEIVFADQPRAVDQYLRLGKLLTPKQLKQLKVTLGKFVHHTYNYNDLEKWSTLHLLSHLVYKIRPEKAYFDMYKGANRLNLAMFIDKQVLEEWQARLDWVLAEKGAKTSREKPAS
ncbi:VirD4-like conjugal transfer protein, CD1115 family [Lysinibacillus sp. BF-4]|uniref:VirD4-like conjugal transfer protein, CD1115 family n=1 Tax=Lysinibacillus sp. BF-4 TaxID=1473546 RepID=UPI0006921D0F|nr:type IV secretory system conjugative DNA transfer family protein [Lysinibacillus sp. BF-4]